MRNKMDKVADEILEDNFEIEKSEDLGITASEINQLFNNLMDKVGHYVRLSGAVATNRPVAKAEKLLMESWKMFYKELEETGRNL